MAVRFYVWGVRHRRSNIDGRDVLFCVVVISMAVVLFYGIYFQFPSNY